MLQIIFGDDEHTAKDGPYARLLKTRKWLYLSAGVLFLVKAGHYDEAQFKALFSIVALPASLLKMSLTGIVGYLVVQYVFLIVQLTSTYDIVLSERFTFRRADELDQATNRVKAARKRFEEEKERFPQRREEYLASYGDRLKKELLQLEAEQLDIGQEVKKQSKGDFSQKAKRIIHTYNRNKSRLALAEARVKEIHDDQDRALSRIDPMDSQEVKDAVLLIEEAERDLAILQRQVPSQRFAYKLAEQAIDVFRLVPPIVIAVPVVLWTA